MIDYTGQTYHKLVFIKPVEKSSNGKTIWELKCDCGKIVKSRYDHVVRGQTRSCCCFRKQQSEKRRKYDPIISSAREVYNRSYSDMDCDFETFYKLSQQNCYYCDSQPTLIFNVGRRRSSNNQLKYGNFVYNGLDRLNNSIGHSIGNIVPCCWTCNYMKRTLTVEEFLTHISKIYNNTKGQHEQNNNR